MFILHSTLYFLFFRFHWNSAGKLVFRLYCWMKLPAEQQWGVWFSNQTVMYLSSCCWSSGRPHSVLVRSSLLSSLKTVVMEQPSSHERTYYDVSWKKICLCLTFSKTKYDKYVSESEKKTLHYGFHTDFSSTTVH